jgi:hypothetical protein
VGCQVSCSTAAGLWSILRTGHPLLDLLADAIHFPLESKQKWRLLPDLEAETCTTSTVFGHRIEVQD